MKQQKLTGRKEAQAPKQPKEDSSPREMDACQALLSLAKILESVGAQCLREERLVEGLGFCERAAMARYRAGVLDEFQAIRLALVGAQGEGAPGGAR